MKLTVAVAQATPCVLDLAASVTKACEWITEAGRQDARLLAFPETWIPVYPLWCDMGSFSKWNHEPAKRLQARLRANSLAAGSAELKTIAESAGRAGVAVVLGANERDDRNGTLYNTLFFISSDGRVLGRHRKLVPTFGERLVWGQGDASGMRAYDDKGLRFSGLVCWEHWMPLSRHVLHAEGEVVHVAAWPHAAEMHQIASRHYAFEGRCYVLIAATYLTRKSIPADFEMAEDLTGAPDVLLNGGSAVIGPDGSYVAGPITGSEKLLVAEIDTDRVDQEKLTLDVAGHYSRPDLFELRVDRRELRPFQDK